MVKRFRTKFEIAHDKSKIEVGNVIDKSVRKIIDKYDGSNYAAIEILKSSYLELMFDLQHDFAGRWIDWGNKKVGYKEHRTEAMILAAIEELIELKRELNLKEWKKGRKKVNVKKVRQELVDTFHFVINIAKIWGLTPKSLFEGFLDKQVTNRTRQKLHY